MKDRIIAIRSTEQLFEFKGLRLYCSSDLNKELTTEVQSGPEAPPINTPGLEQQEEQSDT